jgi:phage baseplate assembly protein W
MVATYKGFNTVGTSKPSFNLRDIELVKRDLLNHFFTRKGERVMLPAFGSAIQDYIFEPMTSQLMSQLREDVTTVINSEPRVELIDMHVSELEHLVRIEIQLLFKPGDVADVLYLEFTED